MINKLKAAFPQIEIDCLTTINDKHTFIFEAEKAVFVTAKDKFHLHIENKMNTEYYFIQNENCVMKTVKGGQCDYVICNNHSVHFTEIKVAKGNNANHRKDAYNQLENTFKYYSNLIDFTSIENLNALVCFPRPRRIVRASASTKRKEFKVKYNLDLQESNYISFE
ncbi:MAG: hypothetical protein RLZZ540_3014 [Bacteroidota bacterium]|jgi:hypothetical protein